MLVLQVRSVVRYTNLLNGGLMFSVIAPAMPIDKKFFLNPINFLFCCAFALVFVRRPVFRPPLSPSSILQPGH